MESFKNRVFVGLWASIFSLSVLKLAAIIYLRIMFSFPLTMSDFYNVSSPIVSLGHFDSFLTVSTFIFSLLGLVFYSSTQNQVKMNVAPKAEPYIWLSLSCVYTVFWLALWCGYIMVNEGCTYTLDSVKDSIKTYSQNRQSTSSFLPMLKNLCYCLLANTLVSVVVFCLFTSLVVIYGVNATRCRKVSKTQPGVAQV